MSLGLTVDVTKRVAVDAAAVAVGRVTSPAVVAQLVDGSASVHAYPQLVRVGVVHAPKRVIATAVGDHIAVVCSDGTLWLQPLAGGTPLAALDLNTKAWLPVPDTTNPAASPSEPVEPAPAAVVLYTCVRHLVLVGYGDQVYMVEYMAQLITPVLSKSPAAAPLAHPLAVASSQHGDTWRGLVACRGGGVHLLGTSVVFASIATGARAPPQAVALTRTVAVVAAGGDVQVYSTARDGLTLLRRHVFTAPPRGVACSSDAAFVAFSVARDVVIFRTAALCARHCADDYPPAVAARYTAEGPVSSVAFVPFLARLQGHWLKDPDYRNTLLAAEGGAALLMLDVCDPGDTWWPKVQVLSVLALLVTAALLAVLQP
eukprot:TRINITY_DN11420_c0_g1_i2.p1 TRINITY_DN11420_c0_g1~~TRINITY_DN11420_c0_g1_i2.p1  ORF type:complete len:372 (+),score=50.38 TRINITY_DN11420_c0_g1_i2:115-1230(+)